MTRHHTLALLVPLLLAGTARAGLRESCQVERVEVQKVANAVIIKLHCDGLVDFSPDWMTMWEVTEDENWQLKDTSRFSLLLENVMTGAASMVNVAQYPVSHVEFQMKPGSRENIGLRCTVVLYDPGTVTVFSAKEAVWDQTRGFRYRMNIPRVAITRSTDQKQVIITVLSNRPEEPEVTRPPVTEAPAALEVSGTASELTVRALHADLGLLVERLAECSGLPIFVDEPQLHRVTAQFTRRPLAEVLGHLATGYGMCLTQTAGAYYLTRSRPDTPASYWASVTRTLPLHYLKPEDALLLMPAIVLPFVHGNSDGNALVANGPAPLLDRIARDVTALDQPSRQCRLRAWVLSVEDADLLSRRALARITGGTTAWGADSAGNLSLGVGTARAREALADLRALSRQGALHLEAIPSLTCAPGQSARLFIGQRVYYLRRVGYYSEVRLAQVRVGSELTIWPRNVGDSITARVNVSNSFAGTQTDQGPTVFTRQAEATLRLRSGDLMVVGGLRAADDTRQDDATAPWLGPLSDLISGRLRQRTKGLVTLLVQAESTLRPPVTPANEVRP